MSEIILNCPFCGVLKVNINRTNKNACWVSCAGCEAQTKSDPTRKGAIEKWNQRRDREWPAEIEDDDEAEAIELAKTNPNYKRAAADCH